MDENGKLVGNKDPKTKVKSGCVWYGSKENFYGSPTYEDGVIVLMQDNKDTEEGETKEVLFIRLDKLSDIVKTVVIGVSLYNRENKIFTTFKDYASASIQVFDEDEDKDIFVLKINEEDDKEDRNSTSMEFCTLTRSGDSWVFDLLNNDLGKNKNGLIALLKKYR